MKSKDSEFWLLLGLLVVLAYTGGAAIEQSVFDGPLPGNGDDLTALVDKIRRQLAASGVDTSKYDEVINSVSQTFSVPVSWIKAVIGRESSFRENPPVRIGDASYGLMQLTPTTARNLGFTGNIPDDLVFPSTNIYFGTMLLGQLRGRFGDDFAAVYSAYNSGSATAYQTSAQVATNVENAQAWLQYFSA